MACFGRPIISWRRHPAHNHTLDNHPLTLWTRATSFRLNLGLTCSCIDRMEGVATNAVIAVPDDKYGEVSDQTLSWPLFPTGQLGSHLALLLLPTLRPCVGGGSVCCEIARGGARLASGGACLCQEARWRTECARLGLVPRRGWRPHRVSQDCLGQDSKGAYTRPLL